MARRPPYANDFDRVWSRVTPAGPTDCWDWQGAVGPRGYPIAITRGRRPDGRRDVRTPAQLAWETTIGPIPAGLSIDHLCRRPVCCNPHHLELVTLRVNSLRRDTSVRYPPVNPPMPFPTVHDAGRTHCKRGHEFAVTGWYPNGVGKRTCAECARDRNRKGTGTHGSETHCPQGHPYSGENLRIVRTRNGGTTRQCRECGRANSRRQYFKRKARHQAS